MPIGCVMPVRRFFSQTIKQRRLTLSVAICCLGLAQITTSPIAAAPQPGSAQRGQPWIASCLGCHGITGYHNAFPSFHIPRIVGQSPAYLEQAMLAYRAGQRHHQAMQAQMRHLSDQEIADLAAALTNPQP